MGVLAFTLSRLFASTSVAMTILRISCRQSGKPSGVALRSTGFAHLKTSTHLSSWTLLTFWVWTILTVFKKMLGTIFSAQTPLRRPSGALLWMVAKSISAPPKKPWNGLIPCKIPTNQRRWEMDFALGLSLLAKGRTVRQSFRRASQTSQTGALCRSVGRESGVSDPGGSPTRAAAAPRAV